MSLNVFVLTKMQGCSLAFSRFRVTSSRRLATWGNAKESHSWGLAKKRIPDFSEVSGIPVVQLQTCWGTRASGAMSKRDKHREREGVAVADERARAREKADAGPASYSDGHPLDVIQYLEAKLILKPDRFNSVESFRSASS